MHQPNPFVTGVGLVHVDMQAHDAAIPAAFVQPASERAAFDKALVAEGVDALVAPLHEQSTDSAASVVGVYAHGVDACERVGLYVSMYICSDARRLPLTCMRSLEPALPGEKRLTEHATGIFSPLGALWIPVALDGFGTIRERVLVENQPLAAPRDSSGFRVDGIDPV